MINMLSLFLIQSYIFLLYSYNPQSMRYMYFCITCLDRSYMATSFLIVYVEAHIKKTNLIKIKENRSLENREK